MSHTVDLDRFVTGWLHADGAADVHAEVVEAAFATARRTGQRRGVVATLVGPAPWPAYGRRIGFGTLPPTVRVAVALALTAALAAGTAVVGSRILRTLFPPPPTAHAFVITRASATTCPGPFGSTTAGYGAAMVDVETGVVRPFPVDCQASLLLSPDGVHAIGSRTDGPGLSLIDLRDGTSRPIPGAEGLEDTGVESVWSPKGTYLVLGGSIRTIDDPRGNPLPTPTEGGGYCCTEWSADESRVLVQSPGGGGWSIGDGDGTGLRPLLQLGSRLLAMSPDGLAFAVALPRANRAGDLAAVDVAVGDGFTVPGPVTHFPDGTQAVAAAWSPDQSTLAVVSASRPDPAIPQAATTNDLWLVAVDGSSRHFALPQTKNDADLRPISGSVAWAPDGGHVLIGWHTLRARRFGEPRPREVHVESSLILSTADGSLAPLHGWVERPFDQVFFSPDGRRVVYHAYGSLEVVDFDGPGHVSLPYSQIAPIGWGNQLVWLPDEDQ